eukprot:g15196.t1
MSKAQESKHLRRFAGNSCHFCHNAFDSDDDLWFCKYTKLRGRQCRKKFCGACLIRKFPNFIRPEDRAISQWRCPSCMDLCGCATCRKCEHGANRKKCTVRGCDHHPENTKRATKPRAIKDVETVRTTMRTGRRNSMTDDTRVSQIGRRNSIPDDPMAQSASASVHKLKTTPPFPPQVEPLFRPNGPAPSRTQRGLKIPPDDPIDSIGSLGADSFRNLMSPSRVGSRNASPSPFGGTAQMTPQMTPFSTFLVTGGGGLPPLPSNTSGAPNERVHAFNFDTNRLMGASSSSRSPLFMDIMRIESERNTPLPKDVQSPFTQIERNTPLPKDVQSPFTQHLNKTLNNNGQETPMNPLEEDEDMMDDIPAVQPSTSFAATNQQQPQFKEPKQVTPSSHQRAVVGGAKAPLYVDQMLLLRGTGLKWSQGGPYLSKVVELNEIEGTVKVQYSDGGFKRFQILELQQLIVNTGTTQFSKPLSLQDVKRSNAPARPDNDPFNSRPSLGGLSSPTGQLRGAITSPTGGLRVTSPTGRVGARPKGDGDGELPLDAGHYSSRMRHLSMSLVASVDSKDSSPSPFPRVGFDLDLQGTALFRPDSVASSPFPNLDDHSPQWGSMFGMPGFDEAVYIPCGRLLQTQAPQLSYLVPCSVPLKRNGTFDLTKKEAYGCNITLELHNDIVKKVKKGAYGFQKTKKNIEAEFVLFCVDRP